MLLACKFAFKVLKVLIFVVCDDSHPASRFSKGEATLELHVQVETMLRKVVLHYGEDHHFFTADHDDSTLGPLALLLARLFVLKQK